MLPTVTALHCLLLCSREYILSCTDEAAKRRQALRGQVPTTWYKGKPRLTSDSWEKMWNDHLHWKRWEKQAPAQACAGCCCWAGMLLQTDFGCGPAIYARASSGGPLYVPRGFTEEAVAVDKIAHR